MGALVCTTQNIPDESREASTDAIVASALFELAGLEDNPKKAETYKEVAIKMIEKLSTDKYQIRELNPAFLLHSTGHWPDKSEIDASINYADYYYIEALLRLKKEL